MIQFCSCNKRFTSSLEISEGEESSKLCRSCGGILSVDERGGLSRKVWSAMGPELSGVIDPQLKWKISRNGKQRALRRARTFTQDNGKKSAVKDLKDIDDLFDKASKKDGNMLVSESEKLGVSLLGRRFSDNLESFPIKKRIISLLPSQSTPYLLSSSGFHDHNQGGHYALFQNNQVLLSQDEPSLYPSHGVELGHEKDAADEKRSMEYIGEHICDSADFSGISILAAAACHSSIEKGLINGDGPTSRVHFSEEKPTVNDEPSDSELGNGIQKPSLIYYSTVKGLSSEQREMKSDECKVEHSVSLQSFPSKSKPVSSRDDRLHWDLNTVMDVWESQPDDYSNCDPHVASKVKSNGSHDMYCGNQRTRQEDTDFGINRVELVAADNQHIPYSLGKLDEEIYRNHSSPVADCDEGKHTLTQIQVCESLQGKCQFKEDKVIVACAPERANPEAYCEKSCLVTTNTFSADGVTDFSSDLSVKIVDLCEDKCESNCLQDTHNTLSFPVITGNDSLSRTTHAFDSFTKDKKVYEMLHDGSRSITTVDSCNDYFGECAYGRMEKNNQLWSPHVDEHHPLYTDVAFNGTTQKSLAGPLENICGMIIGKDDEKTLQVFFDRSSSKSMTVEGCPSDETAYSDEFGNTHANGSQSTTILLNSQGTSNELLPSRNACIGQFEDTSADVKVDNSISYILRGETLNANKVASPFHTNPMLMNPVSEEIILDTKIIPALLLSHGECRTSADVYVKSSEMESVEEHFDSEHPLNASPIDIDHGLEKIDFLGDEDSQYEDGELRESVLNSWGEDGAEEVETEHVDYGSDCREADSFEDESDFCSQSDLAVGTTNCKQEKRSISACDGNRLRITEDSESKCFQKHFSTKDFSNLSHDEGDDKVDTLKDSGKVLDINVVSEVPTRDENRFLASNISTDGGDESGKASQPSSSRMKSSGWDKLPQSEDPAVSLWNNDGSSVTSSINCESARRMVWPIKRDISSRVKISKSFEASCREEVSYARESRKHDHIDLNSERSNDANRLDGRSRTFHSHGRGRVWVDSPPDHHGSCRFDISGYYSSPKFPHSGSRNAAAAAVAKVESNGFVVAPDGTIVKGGSLGPGSHLSGHLSKSSTHLQSTRRVSPMESDGEFCMPSELSNSREVSPGRCFNSGRGRDSRNGSRLFSLGHRNRYHEPILDSRIDSQLLQQSSSRRLRSISPHRRPIHLSREHTRSPSRSRTRSPHTWTSPRGRNDGRINCIPDVKRQSRSPLNFKPQRRIPRQRSPQDHGVPAEEFSAYAPPSRNHSSPPHASRWYDNEKIFQDHLREHQPRHPRGRSPPVRIFSQSSRLDDMDSRGRMKPDEYCEPIYSGRFQDYDGYGRDDSGHGRRGRSRRYEMLHPGGHFVSNSNVDCHHYDDDIRAPNLRPKSLGFQRRPSPRTFDRSFDTQNGHSPQRIKGEMVHFRHGRDGKSNTNYKPFKIRDTSDDMPLQRRPS